MRTTRRLVNFRLDADLVEGLKRVKARDGIPEAEQARRAIRRWLVERRVLRARPADRVLEPPERKA